MSFIVCKLLEKEESFLFVNFRAQRMYAKTWPALEHDVNKT
jgi:hypothetical protein